MFDMNELRRQAKDRDQFAEWHSEGRVDVAGSSLSVDIPLPRRFGMEFIRTRSEWMAGPCREDLHIWFHVDDAGDPFYAGRGRGNTAWDHHGGPAWEWFVRERLHGIYHVAILATGLDERQSEALLDQVMEMYGPFLLNQSNMHRGMDYKALEAYHKAKAQVRPFYDQVLKASPSQRLGLALRAQRLQYEIDAQSTETGRFGEVLAAMGALQDIDQFFIPYIVEGLVETEHAAEAREALSEYLRRAPHYAQAKKIQRLQKIVNRGTFKRRMRKRDEGS